MFVRYRAAQTIGAIGSIIKGVCVAATDIGLFVWAVILATHSQWGKAALLLFIGIPVATFVVDVATGILLALLIGLAALVGWKAATPDDQPYESEDF